MYRPSGWSLYDRRWAFLEGSNDEDILVKYWSNAVLLLPADKSQYPRPLLASASMLGWILLSLVQCFTLCSQVPNTITIMTHHAPNHHFLHTKCVWYWCLWSWAWTQKCIFCSFIWPSRWRFALSSKKVFLRYSLMVCPNAHLSACISLKLWNLYLVQKQVKILVHYSHTWTPWKICLKRLIDFLGDCSEHRLTVRMWFSVLNDCDQPVWPLTLSCTFSVSLDLSRRHFIVRLVGAFLPENSLQNCTWVWTTDFIIK